MNIVFATYVIAATILLGICVLRHGSLLSYARSMTTPPSRRVRTLRNMLVMSLSSVILSGLTVALTVTGGFLTDSIAPFAGITAGSSVLAIVLVFVEETREVYCDDLP